MRDGAAGPSDYELMLLAVGARYVLDADGRLVAENEPSGDAPPRFYLGRTRAGNEWRCRYDVELELAEELDHIAASVPVSDDLASPPARAPAIEAALARRAPIVRRDAGPSFRFPETVSRPDGVSDITEANAALLLPSFPDLHAILTARLPCLAIVRDGIAVSVCYCSRRTARAAEAGVDTLPAHRGRGYATDVTAAWAHEVRGLGLMPLYSTSWDNLASRGVARRLGLVQYGSDLHFT